MYSSNNIHNLYLKISYYNFYNFLIFVNCYSYNVIMKVSRKIPSQALCFPACLHYI